MKGSLFAVCISSQLVEGDFENTWHRAEEFLEDADTHLSVASAALFMGTLVTVI